MNYLFSLAASIGFVVLFAALALVVMVVFVYIKEAYHATIRLRRFMAALTPTQLAKATLFERIKWVARDTFRTYTYIEVNNVRIYRNVDKTPQSYFPG